MIKFLRFLFLVALLCGAAYNYLLYNDFKLPGGDTSTGNSGKGQNEALKQKVLTFSIDGKTNKGLKQWHLEGRAAEIIQDDIHLEELSAEIFGEEFKAHISSDSGIYRRNKEEVELIGNVQVKSEDGGSLSTSRAKWSHATKEITTDEDVLIVRSGMTAAGKGARANSETKEAVLFKDITVKMEPGTVIKCDGPLEVSFENYKAVFHDNVHVVDKDGDLFSDLLTVNIDTVTKKVSDVVAEGNVKLKRGKSYTLCGKATYNENTGTIQFLDKPRIVIDPEEIQETKIFSGFYSTKK
ncbi:MAG: LPS export ABC transporter periplasmic protein LptC [Candidatus Omnitrophica bacterium]|nr:LPS export ABC transporter periplasmic protein LptC [Candidatus Omnitrophota bacterium]